jgi:RNA-binding protein YhbY
MVKPIRKLQIGKNGISEAFIEQLKKTFEDARVVKVVILKSACRDKEEAKKMSEKLVSVLGDKYGYKLVGYVLTLMKFRKVQEK